MGSHSYAGPRHGRPSSPRHAKPMPPSALQRTAAAGGVAAALVVGESLSLAGTAGAVTPDTWAKLRACESSGNYAANTGNGFYGAYQFDARTWHGLGYPGVASQASPAEQDQAAQRLYQSRGWEPWPACSAKLGLVDDRTADRGTQRPPLAPIVVPSPTPTVAAPPAAPAAPPAAPAAPPAAPAAPPAAPAAPPAAPAAPPAALAAPAAPAVATPVTPVVDGRTGWHGQYFTVADVSDVRPDVKAWQVKMVAAGYSIAIDGRYGPRSAAATTKFEVAHGLAVENPGIVGPQVWAALTRSGIKGTGGLWAGLLLRWTPMVTLRPFAEAELAFFDAQPGQVADPYSFFGFSRGSAPLRARWAENRLIGDTEGTLAIDLDGAVIGDVQWRVVSHGPPPMSNAFNIGIRILPAYQGRGHGTDAQIELARYLFSTYPVNRIEAGTDVTNRAEQRALEKAGFTREGIIRGSQWRDGQWRDMVAYSRLRGDV